MNKELNKAIDKITVDMFNTIEHGEEIQLTENYHFYKYCEDDLYTIVETYECEEILAVLINEDNETFTFEQL